MWRVIKCIYFFMHFNDTKIKCSYMQSVNDLDLCMICPTSYVMVSHGDLGDDVCAFSEACFHEALVFLQRLFDHLQLGVHVCHEEIPHPAVRQRQGLQLGHTKQTRFCLSLHAMNHKRCRLGKHVPFRCW